MVTKKQRKKFTAQKGEMKLISVKDAQDNDVPATKKNIEGAKKRLSR